MHYVFFIKKKNLQNIKHFQITNINSLCRVTIYSPSPKCMGYWSNEPNTINL